MPHHSRGLLHLLSHRPVTRRRVFVLLGVLVLTTIAATGTGRPYPYKYNPAEPYAPSLHGKVVSFKERGRALNGDSIDTVVIVDTLHDARPAGERLPDTMLVLDGYVENFQPATAPTMPDLLAPTRPAANAVGFMQGQSALVNAAGHIAYRGIMMAEIFRDASMHLVLSLNQAGTTTGGSVLHLGGVLRLVKGGTQVGGLFALRGLAFGALAAWPGRQQTWQTVVQSMHVQLPRLQGGAAQRRPAAQPTPRPAVSSLSWLTHRTVQLIAYGLAVVLAGVALFMWIQARRAKLRTSPNEG